MLKKIICAMLLISIVSSYAIDNRKVSYKEEIKLSTNKAVKRKIFNENNLRIKSGIAINELDSAFDKINQPQMKELSLAIIDAENYYNVNAIFIASLIAEESGWMRYPAGGGNNLTGYAVYTKTSKGTSFDSKYDNILKTANVISKDYLSTDGKYYNGTSLKGVNIKYCLDENGKVKMTWASNILSIMNELEGVINE